MTFGWAAESEPHRTVNPAPQGCGGSNPPPSTISSQERAMTPEDMIALLIVASLVAILVLR